MTIAKLTMDSLREQGPASVYAREVLQLEKLNELATAVNEIGTALVVVISASLSGNVNDWAPTGYATATTVDITSSTGSYTITGFDSTGRSEGSLVRILNRSGQTLILANASGSSSAANRFNCIGAADTTLVDGGSAWFHKVASDGWRQVGLLTTTVAALRITSLISDGATFNGTTTFNNGPLGVNTYDGTVIERNDDWFYAGVATGNYGDYLLATSGTGAGVTTDPGATGRPGVCQLTSGTTTTGGSYMRTSNGALRTTDYTSMVYEWVGCFQTLSTAAEEYIAMVGFYDSTGVGANQQDFVGFAYDRNNSLTSGPNASKVDKLSAWCQTATVATAVILDGTTQGGITTVDTPVGAGVWPSTNILRLKVVLSPSSAAFYAQNTLRATITTNIPGSARFFGMGFFIRKTAGTTARTMDTDYTRYALTLASARS